ncbi:MAG: hypothetical protein ABH872_02155 [Candidatus Omnitrophota bacterium]
MPSKANKKGLSFVEIIVSVVIITFLVMSVMMSFNVGNNAWHTEMALLDLQQGTRLALDGMSREIRQGENVNVAGANSMISFNMEGTSKTIHYYLWIDNKIYRDLANQSCIVTWDGNLCKTLANDISVLTFDKTGDAVKIVVESVKTSRGRTYNFSLAEIVKLRND